MAIPSRSTSKEIIVIGYGSSLRPDDSAGPRAAAAIADWRLPGVRAMDAQQLTPELAEFGGEPLRNGFLRFMSCR